MGLRTSESAPSSSSNNNQEGRKKRDAHDVPPEKHHDRDRTGARRCPADELRRVDYQRNVRADETNVAVWVAARDIPAGTTGAAAVQKGFLTKSEIVRRSVVPGAISDPEQLAGLVVSDKVLAGEQVTSRRFVAPSERGIHAQLKGVQRAISVPGDKNQLLVGTLEDGDRVDLVATFAAPESAQPHFTRVVLRDVPVLRAPTSDAAAAEKLATQDGAHSVLLKATDTQVSKLHWVLSTAEDWHLELRPAQTPPTARRTSRAGTRSSARVSAASSSTMPAPMVFRQSAKEVSNG